MSAHTPGPWKWTVESVNDEWAIVTDQHGHIIANVNSESGPDIPPVVSTKMPMRANAAFISEAPAMYTALQNVLEWAKGERGSKIGNPYCVPEVRQALRVLASIQGVKDYLDARTKS